MTGKKRYDHETLRTANRAIVFGAVAAHGELSRFDLSQRTGISPATVGFIVEDLLAEGLVREIRVGESTGGRRPVMVALRPEGRYAISGSLTVRGAEFAVVDLAGNIVGTASREAPARGNDAVADLLRKTVADLLASSAFDRKALFGCVADVPGMVNASDGRVLFSPPLDLHAFDLPGLLSDLCGAPSAVYKDTDALLVAERRLGLARKAENAVYVWLKAGLGMSYLHDGELLVLPRGGFELGHTAAINGGRPCHCGNVGCIGTELSETHAVALYENKAGPGARADGYEGLCGAAEAGDAVAREVLLAQADILGATIANVVNLLNPGLVIVGGPLRSAPEEVRTRIRETVVRRSLDPFKPDTRVEFSTLARRDVQIATAADFFGKRLFPLP